MIVNHGANGSKLLTDMLMEIETSRGRISIYHDKFENHPENPWAIIVDGASVYRGRTLYEALCAMRGETPVSQPHDEVLRKEAAVLRVAEAALRNASSDSQACADGSSVGSQLAIPSSANSSKAWLLSEFMKEGLSFEDAVVRITELPSTAARREQERAHMTDLTARLEKLEAVAKSAPQASSFFMTLDQADKSVRSAVDAERKRSATIVRVAMGPAGAPIAAEIEKGFGT